MTPTTRLNNTDNCLTGASLTSKPYTETKLPLTCQVCRVWRTECCPAYPQCCRSWSSQASPHPPEIILDYQPTVQTIPVKQFLKPLPANKRQIRPTKFQDFPAKYRQTNNLELQTLLSPPLKYRTAQELCFCLHHLSDDQVKAWGLQMMDHQPKHHLIHMHALPFGRIYTQRLGPATYHIKIKTQEKRNQITQY